MGCLALSYYEQKLPPFAGRSVFLSTAKAAQRSALQIEIAVQRCPQGNEKSCAGSYKFGFNGQEKVNEIAGIGNHTTALFWEYDTRIARRWNLDPKPQISISDYAVMGLNPIWHNDVLGDIFKVQNTQQAKNDVKSVAGIYSRALSFDKEGNVSVDVSKVGQGIKNPLVKGLAILGATVDPGVNAIRDMVNHEKSFYYGNEAEGELGFSSDQGKSWHLADWKIDDAISGKTITPESIGAGKVFFSEFGRNYNGRPSVSGSTEDIYKPIGFDGAVYLPNAEYRISAPGKPCYTVPRASIIYHELRENYLRVTGKEPDYAPAHQQSIKDEGSRYGNKVPGVVNEVEFK